MQILLFIGLRGLKTVAIMSSDTVRITAPDNLENIMAQILNIADRWYEKRKTEAEEAGTTCVAIISKPDRLTTILTQHEIAMARGAESATLLDQAWGVAGPSLKSAKAAIARGDQLTLVIREDRSMAGGRFIAEALRQDSHERRINCMFCPAPTVFDDECEAKFALDSEPFFQRDSSLSHLELLVCLMMAQRNVLSRFAENQAEHELVRPVLSSLLSAPPACCKDVAGVLQHFPEAGPLGLQVAAWVVMNWIMDQPRNLEYLLACLEGRLEGEHYSKDMLQRLDQEDPMSRNEAVEYFMQSSRQWLRAG